MFDTPIFIIFLNTPQGRIQDLKFVLTLKTQKKSKLMTKD